RAGRSPWSPAPGRSGPAPGPSAVLGTRRCPRRWPWSRTAGGPRTWSGSGSAASTSRSLPLLAGAVRRSLVGDVVHIGRHGRTRRQTLDLLAGRVGRRGGPRLLLLVPRGDPSLTAGHLDAAEGGGAGPDPFVRTTVVEAGEETGGLLEAAHAV